MFRFKQFTIHQDKCAMKVCTDACLFGAWVTNRIKHLTTNDEQTLLPADSSQGYRSLDIGTGTGLLSLMLAQKLAGKTDAIELDKDAAIQAVENFAESPWRDRLQVIQTDILQFHPDKKYDFIVSNPPFFESDLHSADTGKNAAKHDTTLTLQQLMERMTELITDDGFAAVLIPYHRTEYTLSLAAANGFYIINKTFVRQTPAHNYFRTMLLLSKKEGKMNEEEMIIHDEERKYTADFVDLLRDYYLYL